MSLNYAELYNAYAMNDQQVGTLWGLNVKGVRHLYYDADKQKHYTYDLNKEGMCGLEKIVTYLDIPEDGLVTIGDAQYKARYDIKLK